MINKTWNKISVIDYNRKDDLFHSNKVKINRIDNISRLMVILHLIVELQHFKIIKKYQLFQVRIKE
jgi:hypothetical protein